MQFRSLRPYFNVVFHLAVFGASHAASASSFEDCLSRAPKDLAPYLNYLRNPGVPTDVGVKLSMDAVIRKYSPRIWWHSAERFAATDPLDFIANSSLWALPENGGGPIRVRESGAVSPATLNTGRRSLFLKYEGVLPDHESGRVPPPLLWKLGEGDAALRICEGTGDRTRILIEYWYYSAFSHATELGIGNHEGDWEGVAMLIEINLTELNRLEHRLIAAFYAAHNGGYWHCPGEMTWTDDAHPEAFSARGTHATYHRPGMHRAGFITDAAERGRSWDTWTRLRPLVLEPYYGFAGAWGKPGAFSFMSGPQGPGPRSKAQPRDGVGLDRVGQCEEPVRGTERN